MNKKKLFYFLLPAVPYLFSDIEMILVRIAAITLFGTEPLNTIASYLFLYCFFGVFIFPFWIFYLLWEKELRYIGLGSLLVFALFLYLLSKINFL